MVSKVTDIMSNVKTALEGIPGAAKVWKVGQFSPSVIERAAGSPDWPVFLLKGSTRRKLDQRASGGKRLTLSALDFAVVGMTNDRTLGDDDWSQEEAEELERLITAAIFADGTRGGDAVDTDYLDTTYNPDFEGGQVDAVVAMRFTVRHYVERGDLEQS